MSKDVEVPPASSLKGCRERPGKMLADRLYLARVPGNGFGIHSGELWKGFSKGSVT